MIENQNKIESPEKRDHQFSEKALLSAISYLFGWFSAVIVLNIPQYRKHPEIRFHAWQSIVLSSLYFLGSIAIEISHLSIVGFGPESEFGTTHFSNLTGFCSVLLSNLSWVLNLLAFLLWLGMIIRVIHEEEFEVPGVSQFARKIAKRNAEPKNKVS